MKTNSKGMIASALALAAGMGVGLGFGASVSALGRRFSKQSKRPTVVRDIAAEQALATEHQRWNAAVDAKRNAKAIDRRAKALVKLQERVTKIVTEDAAS